MLTLSHRQAALKGIDRELTHLASAPRTKSIRRLVYFHFCLRREIMLRRYWAQRVPRPTSMLATRVTLIPCSPHPLASSYSSSACPTPNTCDLHFGQDVVLQACSKRQPADPKYQLALFIYRSAHGHEVSAIARLFDVSGASSFIPRPS